MNKRILIMLCLFMLLAGAQGVSAYTYPDPIIASSHVSGTTPPNLADTTRITLDATYNAKSGTFISYRRYFLTTPCVGARYATAEAKLTSSTEIVGGSIGGNTCVGVMGGTYVSVIPFTFGNSPVAVTRVDLIGVDSTVVTGSATASIVVTFLPIFTAYGAACPVDGACSFDIYTNGTYTYTDNEDSNYSFPIAQGVEYKIYYNNGNKSQWHNFTAGASDEVWNPTCYTCTPPGPTLTADEDTEIWFDSTWPYLHYAWPDMYQEMSLSGDGTFYLYMTPEANEYSLKGTGTMLWRVPVYYHGDNYYLHFVNDTIDTWYNSTVNVRLDLTWNIVGCSNLRPNNLDVTILDENGDGITGIGVWLNSYNYNYNRDTDSAGKAQFYIADPDEAFDVSIHGYGADASYVYKGTRTVTENGASWTFNETTRLNPQVKFLVEIDGGFTTDYTGIITDSPGVTQAIPTFANGIGKYSGPFTINWNAFTVTIMANGSTQDFSYSLSNSRDHASSLCINDVCSFPIVFASGNGTICIANCTTPVDITANMLFTGFIQDSAKLAQPKGITAGAQALVDCQGYGSYDNNNNPSPGGGYDPASGFFGMYLNSSLCSSVEFSASGYLPQKIDPVTNWTAIDNQIWKLDPIGLGCSNYEILKSPRGESRVTQAVTFYPCSPGGVPSIIFIYNAAGSEISHSASITRPAGHPYKFMTPGLYTISFGPSHPSNLKITHIVKSVYGGLNFIQLNRLSVNKFEDTLEATYRANSTTYHADLWLNGSSVQTDAIIEGNVTGTILYPNRLFSGHNVGEIGYIYLNTSTNQTLGSASFTISAQTINPPIITPPTYGDDPLNSNLLWAVLIIGIFAVIGNSGGGLVGAIFAGLVGVVVVLVSGMLGGTLTAFVALIIILIVAVILYKKLEL